MYEGASAKATGISGSDVNRSESALIVNDWRAFLEVNNNNKFGVSNMPDEEMKQKEGRDEMY